MNVTRWKLTFVLIAACALVLPAVAAVSNEAPAEEIHAAVAEPSAAEPLDELVPEDPQQPLFTSTLCVEPSPCDDDADCGYTKEGFQGRCLPNLGYPEVDSDYVCVCP